MKRKIGDQPIPFSSLSFVWNFKLFCNFKTFIWAPPIEKKTKHNWNLFSNLFILESNEIKLAIFLAISLF